MFSKLDPDFIIYTFLFVSQRTPLDVAVERGHVAIAEILREAGNPMSDVSTISSPKYAPFKQTFSPFQPPSS